MDAEAQGIGPSENVTHPADHGRVIPRHDEDSCGSKPEDQEIPCGAGNAEQHFALRNAKEPPQGGGSRGQGRRRSVDLWFFRPIADVALRFSTGHGVPFHWVCELQRDVVKPCEFAEWHPAGTQETDSGCSPEA